MLSSFRGSPVEPTSVESSERRTGRLDTRNPGFRATNGVDGTGRPSYARRPKSRRTVESNGRAERSSRKVEPKSREGHGPVLKDSQKLEYAMRAMIELADASHAGVLVPAREIAARQQIPL